VYKLFEAVKYIREKENKQLSSIHKIPCIKCYIILLKVITSHEDAYVSSLQY